MTSSQPLVSSRGAAFARLTSRVLETLNEAVGKRRDEGETLTHLSSRLGWHRSALTRALNGTSANLTLKTISDILWACRYDPRDFEADPVEAISPNWPGLDDEVKSEIVWQSETKSVSLPMRRVHPVIQQTSEGIFL